MTVDPKTTGPAKPNDPGQQPSPDPNKPQGDQDGPSVSSNPGPHSAEVNPEAEKKVQDAAEANEKKR